MLESSRPELRRALRCLAGTTLFLLVAMALLLVARRLVGGLIEPLGISLPLLGLTLAAMAWTGRWMLSSATADSSGGRIVRELTLTLALLAAGLAVSLPQTPVVPLVLFWAMLTASETLVYGNLPRRKPAQSEPVATKVDEQSDDGSMIQQLVRRKVDGGEVLSGVLRASFAAGRRILSLHVAFCPPFHQTPVVEMEQTAGPATRIKAGQILPFGARLDLKREEPADRPAEVVVEFRAEAKDQLDD